MSLLRKLKTGFMGDVFMKYMITIIVIILVIGIGLTINNFRKAKKIENITNFNFSYTTGNEKDASVLYEIQCEESCMVGVKLEGVSSDKTIKAQISKDKIIEIENILNKYEVSKWNNFHKTDNSVLDGNSFSINIHTKDNYSVNASGYMMWPNNYSKVKEEIDSLFKGLLFQN